ncbi:MAG: hypothetical protein ABR543_11610 [Gemmatimonadaceae bacterium]
MIRSMPRWEKLVPWLLVVGGLAALGFAVGSDLLRQATFRVAKGEMMLGVLGLGLLTAGVGIRAAPESARPYSLTSLRWETVDTRAVARFLAVTLQLWLLIIVIRAFRIENPVFYDQIAPLTMAGFIVHHLLPLRQRMSFFLLISLAGIWLVFGAVSGAWLIGIGLALIGICHLPVPFPARIVVVCVAGALLMVMRSGHLSSPWSGAIWPILGSMFMFRLALYLYDLRHTKESTSLRRTLSYFFLLPNVVFPLFPVVDFSTFRRTYYDQDSYVIYQRGVAWICRGVIHLLLYRLVYRNLVISPAEVATGSDLVRYIVAVFLLYLRVSGQFHLIVGMLHLFGFRLPETHQFFYMASSFTDFWRRINIYWKDFMLKVVYYPTYFPLRRWGNTFALVTSTCLVFLVTWLTHSYQWFWILGTWLLSWTDVLFWAILAVLLLANSVFEMRHGRVRTLNPGKRSAGDIAGSALRTALTFAVISVLWSLWTSSTVTEWILLWRDVRWNAADFLTLMAVLAGVAVLAAVYNARGWARAKRPRDKAKKAIAILPSALSTVSVLLVLYLMAIPRVTSRLSLRAQEAIRDIRVIELNRRDASLLQRGYYESLTGVNRLNGELWQVYAEQSYNDPEKQHESAERRTGDFRGTELLALAGVTFRGEPFRTNRWGMRDRDYELVPPANTFRIALLGASYSMGRGVGDGETFESLLEEELNREPGSASQPKYEILNFAVGGYTPLHHLYSLENKVLEFAPDALLLISHHTDAELSARHLARKIRQRIVVPYPFLLEMARRAGIDTTTPEVTAEKRLEPYRNELLGWAYSRIAGVCRERGILVMTAYIPMPGDDPVPGKIEDLGRLAGEAGFTVLDVPNPYTGYPIEDVQVAAWDRHPNAAGHRLIARRLLGALLDKPDVLRRGGTRPVRAATSEN